MGHLSPSTSRAKSRGVRRSECCSRTSAIPRILLTAVMWAALKQCRSGDAIQANVRTLRKLRDLGLVVDVDYIRGKPWATITGKGRALLATEQG